MSELLSRIADKEFKLSGELTIYNARALKEAFELVMESANETLSVDCSGIVEIDGAGLQVLLVYWNHVKTRGGEVMFTNVPGSMQQLLDILAVDL